ncbi:MAG: cohesin domain-containing protein [Pseudomonadota bacterium]
MTRAMMLFSCLLAFTVCESVIAADRAKGVAPGFRVGDVSGAPGDTVTVPVSFAADGVVVGLQFDVRFDTDRLEVIACEAVAPLTCGVAGDDGQVTFAGVDFSLMPLADATHEITFRIAAMAPPGAVELTLDRVILSDASSGSVPPAELIDGSVIVTDPSGGTLPEPEIRARPVFGVPGDTIELIFEFINVDDVAVAFQFDLVADDPRISLVSCEPIPLGEVTINCNESLDDDRGIFVAINFSLDPLPSGTFGKFTIALDPDIEVPAELGLSIDRFIVSDELANEITPRLENRIVLVNVQDDVLAGEPGDALGTATAADGALLVVAAPDRDVAGPSSGAVDILRREGTGYVLEQTLSPPAGFQANAFGAAVAVQGDSLVIGAPETPDVVAKGLTPLGAALFQRVQQGWRFKVPIVGQGRQPGDGFGTSVAISGTRIAVGAPGFQAGDGAVFMFDGASGQLTQAELLQPADPVPKGVGAGFGGALALDKGRLAVGAAGGVGQAVAGTVALFEQIGDNLSPGPVLSAPDGQAGDEFGASIALDGNGLVVGAPGRNGSGGAFMFDVQLATVIGTLDPSIVSPGARFGDAVTLLDGRLTVGAPPAEALERDADPISGRVTNFEMIDGVLVTGATATLGLSAVDLESLGAFAQDGFGGSAAQAPGVIVIGAPETEARAGSVAIFADADFVFRGAFEGEAMPEISAR